jgi:membrane-bound lytic murein transglycosylase A
MVLVFDPVMSPIRPLAIAAALAALAAACSSRRAPAPPIEPPEPAPDAGTPVARPEPPPQLVLHPTDFESLEGWAKDKLAETLPALRRSCAALLRKPAAQPLGLYPIAGRPGDWREACRAARRARNDDQARALYERHFIPFRVANRGESEGRFTGYYQARIKASRTRRGPFQVPIWARPDDLISVRLDEFMPELRGERIWGKLDGKSLKPYETRAAINRGALRGRARVLAWADDAVDVFFAEVQGSAVVELDGRPIQIGVAGKNGHVYTAIGRVLIERGELTRETVSMQSIRRWLRDHPKQAGELLEENKAFIFFAVRDGPGPTGSQGVVLTPGRSLAVDRRWLPLSLPLWVETEVPEPFAENSARWRRLMIAQDTGGAIRGPVRGDIYFGDSAAAADQAGRMKGRGGYTVLIPRGPVERGELPPPILPMASR